jgi:hypothetical protein
MKLIIDIPEEYKEQFIKNKCDDLFNSLATNEFGYVLRKSFETATLCPFCEIKIQPTRPTGHWIEKEDYNLDTYYECSECGEDYCIEGDILIHKYCPNCGARMTESEEDNGRKDNDI